MLDLTMLGPAALHRDGVPLALPVRKLLALLMLLVCSNAPLPRSRVVALLWPSLEASVGRRNLRRELARLRETGAADAVRVEADRLAIGEVVRCDVHAFDTALREGRHDDALALWHGPPAEGFVLGDADAFDDWLAEQRRLLAARRQQALRASAAEREKAGDLAGALARTEALLADDALQEQHHRDAIRLFAASGQREAALAQYERCRRLLRDELGLAPMAETEALAASLRGAPAPATAPAQAASTPAKKELVPELLPFVGRTEEVMRLETAWTGGRTMIVEGDAGVGKTRLAVDFASAHGPYALARCRAGDAELPYASFARALRALMGPEPPEMPAWVGQELARLVPELGDAPPPIHSDEERNRFFEACSQAWRLLSAESFDAVVLDDWHLADAASRALIGFIAKRRAESNLAGARELLLLRPELDAAAADALRSLVTATGGLHLRLQPLSGEDLFELVRRLSGASRPVRFAQRLEHVTGGNPFFVAETLRHLVETELLSSDGGGGWHTPFDEATSDYRELPVPASVLETVLARVERLTASSRRVLEAAALAAEPFAPSLLAPACALSELQAVIAIEEAVAARLLREHDAGGFAFAHDLVQQALNSALSDERRRLVHRRLALGAEAAGAPAAIIASHHEASGEPARAVSHRLAAGDQALRLHALQEAMLQWQKALADGPSVADAIRLHDRLGLLAQRRADVDGVRAQADALGAMLEAGTLQAHERIDAAIARADALVFTGRQGQALAELDALPAAPEGGQRTHFLRIRSIALHNLGRADEAMVDAKAALARPDLSDRDRIELLDLAFISDHAAGRAESALSHADAALALSQKIGHALGVARGRYRRGIQRLQMNDVAGAESDLCAAADESDRLGFVNLQRIVLYNLSSLYALQGLPTQALDAARRGWSLEPPIQAPTMRAMFGLAMVDPQQALGDLGAASEAAHQVVVDALAQDDPTVRILAAVGVVEVLGLVGEAQHARSLLDSIDDAALRELANVASEMWVARAQFELAQGDPAAAAQALERLDAAGGVVDPRVRVRCAQARAGLCLAVGDAAGSLSHLPADDAEGMNDEMRLRGLALRLAAESRLGRPTPGTLAASTQASGASAGHRLALLALHQARVEAATPDADPCVAQALPERQAFVETLAQTLHRHPAQQAAFRRNAAGLPLNL